MKYFPKIVNLSGYTAKHWSKMKIGEEYDAVIQLPVMKRYYLGVKKGTSKKQWDKYYLIKEVAPHNTK